MTADEFTAEYRAGHCLTSDGIKTSLAQETRKGRLVMVHELANATHPERLRVQNLLGRLAPNDASQVIGTFDVDGETVVVTKFLLGFTSFLAWLEAAVAESSTKVLHTGDNPPTMDMHVHDPRSYRRPLVERSVAPALEDTSIKTVLATPAAQAAPPPLGKSSPPPPAASTAPPPLDEPTQGFTKLFGEPSTGSPGQEAVDRNPEGHVNFTELFGAPAEGSGSPSQRSRVEESDESLGSRPDPLPPASPAPASRYALPNEAPSLPDAVKSSAADEPATGDFTRLFGDAPSLPSPLPSKPKPPPIDVVSPAPKHSVPLGSPAVGAPPLQETRPAQIAPPVDASPSPPPPRLRLDALEGSPAGADSLRGDLDARDRERESVPPAPFSVPPLITGPASRNPISAPEVSRPNPRPNAAIPAPSSQGGYTEVLTPARPPLNAVAARTPTPSIGQVPQPPRSSYTPLIVGLVLFVALVAIVLTVFVLSSS